MVAVRCRDLIRCRELSALFVSLFYVGVGGGVFYGGLSHARVCVEVECYLGCSMHFVCAGYISHG